MKKNLLFLLMIALLMSCAGSKLHTEKYRNKDILVGTGSLSDIQQNSYQKWFYENANEYTPDAETIKKLIPQINKYKYKIVMGTWCPDSRKQVPVFYKILKESNYKKPENIPVIYVPRKYKNYNPIKEFNIKRVPTIIILEKGKEKGRIIEYPMETIEKDLLHILEGNYKHELDN